MGPSPSIALPLGAVPWEPLLAIGLPLVIGVLVAWWAYRKTRRLYEKARDALEGARVATSRVLPFPSRVEGRWRGRDASFWKREGGQNSPSKLYFRLAGTPLHTLRLAPEGAFERMAKKLGISKEVEIGDAEIDDAFMIHAEHPEAAGRILTDPAGKRAALELADDAFQAIEIGASGLEAVRIGYSGEDFEPSAVRQRFERLQVLLDLAEGRGSMQEVRRKSAERDLERWVPQGARRQEPAPAGEIHTAPDEVPVSAGAEDLEYAATGYRPLEPSGEGRGKILLWLAILALAAWLILRFAG